MVLKWLTYMIFFKNWNFFAPWQQKQMGLQLSKGFYWKVIPQIHHIWGRSKVEIVTFTTYRLLDVDNTLEEFMSYVITS
jgi:hypothetical protein